MRTCSVEGCDRKHWAKNLCRRHYVNQSRLDPVTRDKHNATTKKWLSKNRDRHNDTSIRWYYENKERNMLNNKIWRNKNKIHLSKMKSNLVEKIGDSYIRDKFKLPAGTSGQIIDSCRALILNVRRMRNERP